MSDIPDFKTLSADQQELLTKYYCFGSIALITLNSSQPGLAYKARGARTRTTSTTSTTNTSTSLEFRQGNGGGKVKKTTDGNISLNLDYTPKDIVDNMKGKLDLLFNPKTSNFKSTGTISYSNEKARGAIQLCDDPLALTLTATGGYPEYGLGAKLGFDFGSQRFSTYDLAGWWHRENLQMVLKHQGRNQERYALGDLVFSYYQKTTDQTRIGAEVSANFEKGNTDVQVGGDYKYDDTLLKVKMNSEGKLAGAFVHDVNKNIKFTLSAEVDVNRMTSTSVNDFRLGFRLDFNHENN